MSGLLIPPVAADRDRASMVLPTIKCSSCGEPIPLSALGDHICRPPSRSAKSSRSNGGHGGHGGYSGQGGHSGHRQPDVNTPSRSRGPPSASGSSSRRYHEPSSSRAPPMPAFGGPMSPPGGLQIPPAPSPMSGSHLSPHSASSNSRSPSPHTPSPTNPFFPTQQANDEKDPGLSVFGLGFNGAGIRPEGPFPNDRPLPAGVSDLLSLTDSSRPSASSGVGGMAGVGRRAFQAAAWGVTAGITMAAGSRSKTPQPQAPPPIPSQPQSVPMSSHPRSAGAEPSSMAPWQSRDPRAREQPRSATMPQNQRSRGGTEPLPGHHRDFHPSPTIDVPPRSASSTGRPPMPIRSATSNSRPPAHQHNGSISSHTSHGSQANDFRPVMSGRNDRTPTSAPKNDFFEKYKQMQTSTSDKPKTMGIRGHSRSDHAHEVTRGGYPKHIVDSPQQSCYDLEDAYEDLDGDDSALPWATPALEDSPEIQQHEKLPKLRMDRTDRTPHSKLNRQRYPGPRSEASSNSSDGRYGLTSGPEEEIVTPSTSFEGLSERLTGRGKKGYGYEDGPIVAPRKHSDPRDTPSSRTPKSKDPHSRSRTTPEPTSSSRSTTSSRRPSVPKTCQKCGDTVGGSRKFVERDGVVLCEADWKKMYLPTCRKCHQLIETKMVSADDGQLKGKWHSSCFTCSKCDKPFEGKDFYVHAGRPWCQYHYAKETGTLCASSTCRKPIEGPCIVVQGTDNPLRFHPGHLRCDHRGASGSQTCREPMDEYFDIEGKRYCERHVGEALKGAAGSGGGMGGKALRAEKRKTRLVDLQKARW